MAMRSAKPLVPGRAWLAGVARATASLFPGAIVEGLGWGLARRQAVGEAGALRRRDQQDLLAGLASGGYATPYQLNTSRVDYQAARALYQNTLEGYQLGGAFPKPIINSAAAFIGLPDWTHPDEAVQQLLADHREAWTSELSRLVRNVLRDGDVFARVDPPATGAALGSDDSGLCRLRLIPPEWVQPVPDPLGDSPDAWSALVIAYPMRGLSGPAGAGRELHYTLVETLTARARTLAVRGEAPEELQALDGLVEANPYGQIPVVHFANEAEDDRVFGASELEPVEPFLKAYHDVLLRGCQGHALFAKPKIKFTLNDKAAFLRNNFTTAELASRQVRLQGKDAMFFAQGEDAAFLTADSGVAATDTLLQLLYRNIVDVSETPEYVFGTAVQSSRASVQEQATPLIKKAERKRAQLTDPFRRLAGLALVVRAAALSQRLEPDAAARVALAWPPVTSEDAGEKATTIKTLVDALVTAMEAGLVSVEAAAETLREQVPSMEEWEPRFGDEPGERERVESSLRWLERIRASTLGLATPRPGAAGPGGPPEPDEGEEDEEGAA
jgi:hypothetical protein